MRSGADFLGFALAIVILCAIGVAAHQIRERRRAKRRAAFYKQFPRAEWRNNNPGDDGEKGHGDDSADSPS